MKAELQETIIKIGTTVIGVMMAITGYFVTKIFEDADKIDSMNVRLIQVESEQDDIWAKYNKTQDKGQDIMKDYENRITTLEAIQNIHH